MPDSKPLARETLNAPPMDGPPLREEWIGRVRYIVIPVVAVLAIATAIYLLDDSNAVPDQNAGVGAANPVQIAAVGDAAKVPAPRIGSPAPDFTLPGVDGKPVKLSDFRGKTVFLNFFATWCPPCRAEMPDIEATYQEHKDSDVVVLAVSMQEEAGAVAAYVGTAGLTFPIVLDRSGYVSSVYRISAIPTSFFVDKSGVIRDMQIGALSKTLMQSRLKKAM